MLFKSHSTSERMFLGPIIDGKEIVTVIAVVIVVTHFLFQY